MVANLIHKEIEIALAGKNLRIIIYIVTGYLKAVNIASSLGYLYTTYPPGEIKGFIMHISVGMLKLGSTVLVYSLDRFICYNDNFDEVTLSGIYRRLKLSVILICLLIEVSVSYNRPVENSWYDPNPSYINLIAIAYMIIWYLDESHQYGLKFRQD